MTSESAPMLDSLRIPSKRADHLFHDSADCPFRAGITTEAVLVTRHPRRCNWCTAYDRPTSS